MTKRHLIPRALAIWNYEILSRHFFSRYSLLRALSHSRIFQLFSSVGSKDKKKNFKSAEPPQPEVQFLADIVDINSIIEGISQLLHLLTRIWKKRSPTWQHRKWNPSALKWRIFIFATLPTMLWKHAIAPAVRLKSPFYCSASKYRYSVPIWLSVFTSLPSVEDAITTRIFPTRCYSTFFISALLSFRKMGDWYKRRCLPRFITSIPIE